MKFDELYNGVMNEGLGYYGYGSTSSNKAHEAWKSRERNAGLEGEERRQREEDRGPWYIKVDGVTLKQDGRPKVFNWRSGASNYASAILKNNPSLKGKVFFGKQSD